MFGWYQLNPDGAFLHLWQPLLDSQCACQSAANATVSQPDQPIWERASHIVTSSVQKGIETIEDNNEYYE